MKREWKQLVPRARRSDRGQALAHDAGIAYNECMQYTIRGVPPEVDAAIRRRARESGTSLNRAANGALAEGAGVYAARPRRDLRDIAGSWKRDRATEEALAAQDAVDEALWQ